MPLIASAKTSHEAWLKLTKLYASRSQGCILHLKRKISSTTHGDKFILDFCKHSKAYMINLPSIMLPLMKKIWLYMLLMDLGKNIRKLWLPFDPEEHPSLLKNFMIN